MKYDNFTTEINISYLKNIYFQRKLKSLENEDITVTTILHRY